MTETNILHELWKYSHGETPEAIFAQWLRAHPEIEGWMGYKDYAQVLGTHPGQASSVDGSRQRLSDWLVAHHPSAIVAAYGYLAQPWERVRYFDQRCQACGMDFAVPLLGDFAYGPLLFYGERGGRPQYFVAILGPMWDEIEELHNIVTARPSNQRGVPGLQWIIAHCVDPLDAQSMTTWPVCPHCEARLPFGNDTHPAYDTVIPAASFWAFRQLDRDARLNMVRDLWQRSDEVPEARKH